MITVSTKEGLQKALKNRESQIRVTGDLAKSMRKKSKIKKGAKIGGALMVIGGIVAIPFTVPMFEIQIKWSELSGSS